MLQDHNTSKSFHDVLISQANATNFQKIYFKNITYQKHTKTRHSIYHKI